MYKFICQLERGQIFLAPLGGGGGQIILGPMLWGQTFLTLLAELLATPTPF